jgi:hypothetical protein
VASAEKPVPAVRPDGTRAPPPPPPLPPLPFGCAPSPGVRE